MMSSRRRWTLIIASVGMGTFFAALLVKSRIGTLNTQDWQQLAFNFAFAVAIVLAIGMLFKMTTKKEKEKEKKGE
jgi:uncharacterized protein involved in response to NO